MEVHEEGYVCNSKQLLSTDNQYDKNFCCRYTIVIFSNQASAKQKTVDEWKLKIASIANEVLLECRSKGYQTYIGLRIDTHYPI